MKEGGTDIGTHNDECLWIPYINIQLSTHQHSAEQDIKLRQAKEPPPHEDFLFRITMKKKQIGPSQLVLTLQTP